jgi:hypothetical protein
LLHAVFAPVERLDKSARVLQNASVYNRNWEEAQFGMPSLQDPRQDAFAQLREQARDLADGRRYKANREVWCVNSIS